MVKLVTNRAFWSHCPKNDYNLLNTLWKMAKNLVTLRIIRWSQIGHKWQCDFVLLSDKIKDLQSVATGHKLANCFIENQEVK